MDTLRAACQSAAKDSPKTIRNDHQQLLIELKHNQDILTEINNGIRYLDSEYNEEWDDWYNSDADEVLFSDPIDILPEIEDAIRLIRCGIYCRSTGLSAKRSIFSVQIFQKT